MKRQTRTYLAIAERLDQELNKSFDLFFELRLFLENNVEPEILGKSDEYIEKVVDNTIAIEQMNKRLKELTYGR